jgi:hypothetical protein
MPKQIVPKSEIKADPKLLLVKAYRILNKRIGEDKAIVNGESDADAKAEAVTRIETSCAKLKAMALKADREYGFKIWVNLDGKTGHTYEKDYKATRDEDNDYDAYMAQVAEQMLSVETLLNSIPLGGPVEDDTNN